MRERFLVPIRAKNLPQRASSSLLSSLPQPWDEARDPAQRACAAGGFGSFLHIASQAPGVQKLATEGSAVAAENVHDAARLGTQGTAQQLPFLKSIQRSFGHHDMSGVKAHTDCFALRGAQMMGARAFAQGNRIAFGERPSLRMAAHEAAHIVQQRSSLHLPGGVGGLHDAHERHADAVADRVAAGQSSESLLNQYAPAHGSAVPTSATAPVQGNFLTDKKDELARWWAHNRQQPRTPLSRVNWTAPRTANGANAKSVASWNPGPGLKIKVKPAHDQVPEQQDRAWLVQLLEGNTVRGSLTINYQHSTKQLQPDNLHVEGTTRGQGFGALLGKEAIKAMLLPQIQQQTAGAQRVKLNCVNPLSAHISIKEMNLKFNAGDIRNAAAVTAATSAVAQLNSSSEQELVNQQGETRGGYRMARFPEMWGRMANLTQQHGVTFDGVTGPINAQTDFTSTLEAFLLAEAIASQGRTRGGGGFALNLYSPIPSLT